MCADEKKKNSFQSLKMKSNLNLCFVLITISTASAASINNEVVEAKSQSDFENFGSDFMYGLLRLAYRGGLLTEDDLKVHFLTSEDGKRQARSDK